MYIIIALIIILVLVFINYKINNKGFIDNYENYDEVIVERPFVNLYDNNGNKLNVILISKPFGFDEDKSKSTYLKLKENNVILGITSYLEFPNVISNPFDDFNEDYKKHKYKEWCEGWLYCFRNPEDYFSEHIPKLLISESDFMDCYINKPKNVEKIYDFIYICLKQDESSDVCDDWATYNKNWQLGKKCLSIMCKKFKLKGALIGRKDCEIDSECDSLMHTTNMLSNDELKTYYDKSRFIFIPNVADASPRVLAEALLYNIPCLVNKNILGGWKYVNNNTGMFFNDENDIEDVLSIFLKNINNYTPRQFFLDNYGPVNSGKKLKNFIFTHFKDRLNRKEKDIDYLTIDYPKVNFKTCQN